MARPKYRPKTTVLQDAGISLNELARRNYYNELSAEDKALVDALCQELSDKIGSLKGKTSGIGAQGMLELALALYVRVAYPGKNLDQCLQKATVG